MALQEGAPERRPSHFPTPNSLLEESGRIIRGGARWVRRYGARAGLAIVGVVAPAIGIWEWNQQNQQDQQKPIVPQEQSIDAPRDIFPQPAKPEIKAVIPWPDEIATPMATPEPSPTTTPTTAPAKATAIPSGYVMENGNLIYRTEKGDILKLPKVPGLEIKLEGNKATYVDKEGRYAGEFKPNVSMANETGKQEQRGGLVLTAPVVLNLINQKLATIPNQKDKWVVALPVDIRDLDSTESVVITSTKSPGTGNTLIKVIFNDEIPLVNIIPDTDKLRIGKSAYYGMVYSDILRYIDPYTDYVYPGKEMSYISAGGPITGFSASTTITRSFGEKVSNIENFAVVAFGAAKELFQTPLSKILLVDSVPAFLAANPS